MALLAAKYSLHRKNIASKKRPAETGPSGDFIQTQMLYRLTKRLIASKSKAYSLLVMGCDQNLRETSVNVISHFTFAGTVKTMNDNFPYFL